MLHKAVERHEAFQVLQDDSLQMVCSEDITQRRLKKEILDRMLNPIIGDYINSTGIK